MNTYMVIMKEVHERIVRVKANGPHGARLKAYMGKWDEVLLEPTGETFVSREHFSLWNVELEKEENNIEDCLLYTE